MRRMYSENQVIKLIEEQDLKPKTIAQQEANWSFDVEDFPNVSSCTASPIFCRIQQLNQELHIVMLGKINNPTASDLTAYSTQTLEIELPAEIASKIYDVLGNTASTSPGTSTRISTNYGSCFIDGQTATDMSKYQPDVCMHIVNLTGANKIGIIFARPTAITLKAGKDTYLEARVSLDLI